MFHILLGIATVAVGAVALLAQKKQYLNYQLAGFAATLLSGVVLVAMQPQVMAHLCVSGTMFSIVTIGLYVAGKRAIAASHS